MLDKVARHIAPRSRSRDGAPRSRVLPGQHRRQTRSPSGSRDGAPRSRDGAPRSRVLAVQSRPQMHRAAAEWVLRRLPVDAASLAKLSKTLRLQQHRRHRESADRLDTQSAAEAVGTWLATEPKEVRKSLWGLMQPQSKQMTSPWRLPCIACPECGRPSENTNHRQKRVMCQDCTADRRRLWDRDRRRLQRE
jgi:hypothetical protein